MRLHGAQYCRAECLELALIEILRERPAPHRRPAPRRIPLGLLLLSRQQLTADQLRFALEAQREASCADSIPPCTKKIGAWLQELGFVTEQQVTAALARQWSRPLLQSRLMTPASRRFPPIPSRLLECFQMMPADVCEPSRTLLMAFSDGIDYPVLYAIEQMLGCRTEPCLVPPSTLRTALQSLAQERASGEINFDRVRDAGECAHIVANYASTVKAEEVRLARCGEYFWFRLELQRREAVTLLFSFRPPIDESYLAS